MSTDSKILQQEKVFGFFVYSLPKSASVFLYQLFKDFSIEKNMPYFSIHNQPKVENNLYNHKQLNSNIKESFCFCPQRNFLIHKDEEFVHISELQHILQVRDPRDILVSQYFSEGWTHNTKSWDEKRHEERKNIQKMSIDDYCISRATDKGLIIGSAKVDPSMPFSLLERYQPAVQLKMLPLPNCTFVKYEDMVTNFRNWLSQVISPLQFSDDLSVVEKYYEKYKDEFILEEEQMSHKRKITPGDHKEKLQSKTIEKLNDIFSDVLDNFDYLR